MPGNEETCRGHDCNTCKRCVRPRTVIHSYRGLSTPRSKKTKSPVKTRAPTPNADHTTRSAGENVGAGSRARRRRERSGTAAWSGVGGFLQSETFSPYDPAIVLLGISQKEMKTYVRANPAQGWLFTAASFTVAPTRGDRDVLQRVSGSMTCRTSGRRNLTQR